MRVSTRILLSVFLLTGLWTWSGASAVCEAAVELSAAPTCCPDSCQCEPSACGCSVAPAESRPATEEAPMLLTEAFSVVSDLQTTSFGAWPACPVPGAMHGSAHSAWVIFSSKHSDVMLELHCVQIV